MKMIGMLVTLCVVISIGELAALDGTSKDVGHIGAYPTNFFKDMVPRFVNNRPTIGVLTIGLDGDEILKTEANIRGKAYFGASYVKFIESAGARAVPIREDILMKDLQHLLAKLNGVILPGYDKDTGDAGYYRVLKRIVMHSKKQFNKKGELFPILAICRGAERLMMAVSGKDFKSAGDLKNISLPLKMTDEVHKSQLFGHMPVGLLKALQEKPLAFYYQAFVLPIPNFYNTTQANKEFRVLATNTDRNGTEFISTYEGRKYPWYGIMWHPEKPQFVFNPVLSIDHSIYSVVVSQYVSNFFVGKVRQNPNRFDSRRDEESFMIYKDSTVYVGNVTESQYEEIYTYDLKVKAKVSVDNEEDEDEKKKKKKNFDFM